MSNERRYWEDFEIGDFLGPVEFPLSIYRLILAAAATRDFNQNHHNTNVAQASGAPDMYANTTFLLGMWERAIREFIGLAGHIVAIRGFRMRSFNAVGHTVVVKGVVEGRHVGAKGAAMEIRVWSQVGELVTVGPGTVVVTLPVRGYVKQSSIRLGPQP